MTAEGRRVVLIIARRGEDNTTRLTYALEQLEKGGYTLAAVVDPEQYLDALRMVVDGLADLVVITAAEHFPLVQHVADLNGAGGSRRARPVLRPAEVHHQAPRTDGRPRLVQSGAPALVEHRAPILPRDRRTQVIRRTA